METEDLNNNDDNINKKRKKWKIKKEENSKVFRWRRNTFRTLIILPVNILRSRLSIC